MTNHADRHDDYVNGRAAEEVQADRARQHDPATPDEPHEPTSRPDRPGLIERLGRLIDRLSGRSRAIRRPVGATLAAGLLVLAGCSTTDAADEADEVDAAPAAAEDDTGGEDPTDAPEGEEAAAQEAPRGTSTCTDPVDDSIVVDQETFDAYDGDAYQADAVELRLEVTDNGLNVRTQENQDKIDTQPAGPLRFDIWLAALDGSETALVRAHAPAPGVINVEVGADEASLEPIEGGSPRFGAAGNFMMSIDRDLLPVLDEPFGFAYVETMEGNGTADICPNDASINDPLSDVEALQAFGG